MKKEIKTLTNREIYMKISSIENLEKNLASDTVKRDKLSDLIKKRTKALNQLIEEVQDTELYKKLRA